MALSRVGDILTRVAMIVASLQFGIEGLQMEEQINQNVIGRQEEIGNIVLHISYTINK